MFGPTFYENADPVPRGVENVTCSAPLQGEWIMNPDPPTFTWPGNRYKHRVSITAGADLVFNPNATADSTFGGAIKFIYALPTSEELYSLHPPWYNDSGRAYTIENDEIRKKFGARRTWTHQDDDYYEYPRRGNIKNEPEPHYFAAVQRVLNEFNWETWRAYAHDNPDVPGNTYEHWIDVDGKKRCILYETDHSQVYFANSYTHPYYDATCIGLDAQHLARNQVPLDTVTPAKLRAPIVPQLSANEDVTFIRGPKHDDRLPPITGRCFPSLFGNDGVGSLHNSPPSGDAFFQQYRAHTTLDPALGRIIKTVDLQWRTQSRKTFKVSLVEKQTKNNLLCNLAKDMKNLTKNKCPLLVPRPFTTAPTHPHRLKLQEQLQKRPSFKKTNAYKRGMMVAEDPFTLFIWDTRLIHGIFMTIIAMFVTPVSFFLTRYFKETFMNSRIFLLRVWYFVHLSLSFITILLFMVGLSRQIGSKAILGVSLSRSGLAHRIMGWMSVVISILLFVLGGIRPLNRQFRAIVIILHGVMGLAFYWMSLACMITANAIPGSPAAYQDFSVLSFSGGHLRKEAVFVIVTFWIFFDIAMHVMMTILQSRSDKEMKLNERRLILFSMIPVLLERERFDAPGRFARIYMLRAYIVMALACTVTICIFMLNYSPRKKGLGFMVCTHEGHDFNIRQIYSC
ncbi:uncharacterized protein LOC118435238 [Folsomia candida]|nr:uncharacterized protein LOC118435238 [Folsomia candida]